MDMFLHSDVESKIYACDDKVKKVNSLASYSSFKVRLVKKGNGSGCK
jgi:hypothetical protein